MQRNSGKCRGSTISGYLRGDDQTYVENFRMDSITFDKLLGLLEQTSFATARDARRRLSAQPVPLTHLGRVERR